MLVSVLLAAGVGVLLYKLFQLRHDQPALWTAGGIGVQGPRSRRLGNMESMLAFIGDMGVIVLSNVLIIRSKTPLTETAVCKALLPLSQKHPLLRMRLGKENGQYSYMKEMEEFQLDLKVCDDIAWQDLMEDQLHHVYDTENGPLWRVRLIPQSNYDDGPQETYPYQAACVFAFHHVIIDGTSYTRLFNEFLLNLHQVLDGEELPASESVRLLPPLDAYIDRVQKHSVKKNLKLNSFRIFMSVGPYIMSLLGKFMKAPVFIRNLGVEIDRNLDAPRRTAIIPVELSKAQTSQLLATCKKHKVTVHCAIQTAASIAYLKMADGGMVKETHKFNCGSTCNLRPYLDTDELTDYLGGYFSLLIVPMKVDPNSQFWDIANVVNSNLRSQLQERKPIEMMEFIAILSKSKAMVNHLKETESHLPGGRDRDLVFTNLGNLKYLERNSESNVKLTARFGASAEHIAGAVFGHNLTTFNGVLFWTFVYYSHVTSKSRAQEYVDYTIHSLLEAIKD